MYTPGHPQRLIDPDDRAHDHLAAAALRLCAPEDIDATMRVLTALQSDSLLQSLAEKITHDPHGNPVTDTPDQKLTQATWSAAHALQGRLRDLTTALGSLNRNGAQQLLDS